MSKSANKNFIYALATLIGTIVGAGVFGLPYVFEKAGFIVGLIFLLVFAVITTLIHLLYGEVILRTKESHRLIGFATTYLGKRWGYWSAWLILFGLFGSLLVYIILGGKFLFILFGGLGLGLSETLFASIFFALGAFLVLFGIRSIARTEVAMSLFLFGIIAFLFIKSIPQVHVEYLTTVNFSNMFSPYGVVLFSFAGAAAIPELLGILGNNKEKLKKVITIGTLVPAIFYILFVVSVLGVSGESVSEEAIEGLAPHLGRWVVVLGAAFGFFATFTSFLVIGVNLRDTFIYDYRIPRIGAWMIALGVPFVLFLLGVTQFIGVVGFVGAMAGGLTGISVILMHKKAQVTGTRTPEYTISIPKIVSYGIIAIFVFGMIWELIRIFR